MMSNVVFDDTLLEIFSKTSHVAMALQRSLFRHNCQASGINGDSRGIVLSLCLSCLTP